MVKVSHFVQASHPGTKSEFQSILVNPSAVWRCSVQQRSSLQWLFLRVILSLLVGLVATHSRTEFCGLTSSGLDLQRP
jgi:hypothetical protein